MKNLKAVALALLCAISLGACSSTDSLNRELPALPSYVKRVDTPEPKAGEAAIVVAARERAAKAQANCIIESASQWYSRVRETYADELSPSDIEKEAAAACGVVKK